MELSIRTILVLCFTLISLGFTQKSKATVFSGTLDIINKEYYLIGSNSKLKLQILDFDLKSILNRLKENDYVSIEGVLSKETSTISIIGFNYIGLSELKGLWTDENGVCYYIMNFTKFKTFIPTPTLKCNKNNLTEIRKLPSKNLYNYTITPNNTQWSMFISNETTQYLAELDTTSEQPLKKISLFDSVDGSKISTITLKPSK